ncbi:cysteine-rich and transmembrane domain-containing protein 1-like isoform X2 [Scophthalmus maximus]|uniref:cysteine-rich and transmembrane domain-containing protein 1-like isoform X2 n=1 Tax=Scophthalmus maximus TaxID=52904 RepID=UPI001FA8AF95|nr:cysteine-rich and transmembrane domain-containing protein 1-like isoform X2 [Scophthalmus maximus]
MSREQPPPYRPFFPEGPVAPGGPPALISQPAAFTGSTYQTFPQNYAGGGAQTYFGPPALMGPPLAFNIQPGFQEGPWGEACKTSYHWKGPPPKHTVFVVEQQDEGGGGGGSKHSCLSVCSTILCCCCLWNMLTSHLA